MNYANSETAKIYKNNEFLKEDKINELLNKSNENKVFFNDLIKEEKLVNKYVELALLNKIFEIPYLDLDLVSVETKHIMDIPFEFFTRNGILPLYYDNKEDGIVVGIIKPESYLNNQALRYYFNDKKLIFRIVEEEKLEKLFDLIESKKRSHASLEEMKIELMRDKRSSSLDAVSEEEVQNAPAVKLVDSIIKEAVSMGASDVHIEPYEESVRVRYRIDGILSNNMEFTKNYYQEILTRYKIIAGLNIAEKRIPQDGRIDLTINDIPYDFRVSTLPTINGEKIVIRIYDNSTRHFLIHDLGFSKKEEEKVRKMVSRPHGIILLTGPTGCGKSTTLYAFLRELNDGLSNIITVEDPVENEIYGINQTQVNPKANLTFAASMRSILRQDPNIIMVGEIRDEETAQIAIRAAITGHLVLSTLHTNDAPGAVNRLVNMGVPSYLVADSTIGIISQRLVRRLCPVCKKEHLVNEDEMRKLGIDKKVKIYEPVGCNACSNTGYRGRVAVHEIMQMGPEVRSLVINGGTVDEIRDLASQNGMSNLWESCRDRVLMGETSLNELEVFAESYEIELKEELKNKKKG